MHLSQDRCILLWCALLVSGILLGHASVRAEEEETEVPWDRKVEFFSKNETFNVQLGDTISLPCDIVKYKDDVIRVWMKDDNVLFAGDFRVTSDDRISVEGNGGLKIEGILPNDEAVYACQVNSQISPNSIHHRLILPAPPKVKTYPESGERTVFPGDKLQIACTATGNPDPTITWRHMNLSSFDVNSMVRDNIFEVAAAQRKHAGTYQCTATNGVGDAAVAYITVKVIGKPTVKTSIRWASGKRIAELLCVTHSDIPVTTRWVRGDMEGVLETGRLTLRTVGNHYIARVENVTAQDYDNYTCESTNSKGVTRDTVELAAVPPKPEVSAPEAPSSTAYGIVLTTATPFAPREFTLYVRQEEDKDDVGKWRNITIPAGVDHTEDSVVTISFIITNLEPETSYEAYAVAVNEHGRSQPTAFSFTTPADAQQKSQGSTDGAISTHAKGCQLLGCLTVLLLSFFFW